MAIKLDLSQFKHVKSDSNTTTLQHKAGHTLTIAHKSMSPEAQKQLTALATSAQTPLNKQEAAAMMATGGLPDNKKSMQNAAIYGTNTAPVPTDEQLSGAHLQPVTTQSQKDAVKAQLDKVDQENAADQARLQNGMTEGGMAKSQIVANNTPEGVKEANKRKQENPNGSVIVLHDDKPKSYGKVQMKADGGTLQAASNNQSATNSTGVASAGDMWHNLTHAFDSKAEGGMINPKLSESKKVPKQAKYCMYCGGMAHGGECSNEAPKMYAEGTNGSPVSNEVPVSLQPSDITNTEGIHALTNIDPAKALANQLHPDIQRVNHLYNDMLTQKYTGGASDKQDVMPYLNDFSKSDTNVSQMDTDLYQRAIEQIKAENNMKTGAAMDQQAQQNKENQFRQMSGQPGNMPNLSTPPAPIPGKMPASIPDSSQDTTSAPAEESTQSKEQTALTGLGDLGTNQGQKAPDLVGTDLNNQNQTQLAQSAAQNQVNAIQTQQTAQSMQAGAEARALQQAIRAQNDVRSKIQSDYDNIMKEYNLHQQEIEQGQIDPNRYWTGTKDPETGKMVGGHSQLASAIGIIIAGFNPTTKPNAAIEMLKYNIDNNIKSQIENLNSKKTLLASNIQQFGNIRDAAEVTRAQLADQVKMKLAKAAADQGTPQAAAAAANAIAGLQNEYGQKVFQASMRQSAQGMFGQNNGASPDDQVARAAQMQQYYRVSGQNNDAEALGKRIVPGFGVSSTNPVSDADRAQFAAIKQVNDLMNMSLQVSKGPMSIDSYQRGAVINGQLLGAIKNAQQDGALTESRAKFLTEIIGSNPAGPLSHWTSDPKVKEAQTLQQMELNHKLDQYGLPHYQLVGAEQPQQPGQQNSQPQTQTINDSQYKKVTGGWQKVK